MRLADHWQRLTPVSVALFPLSLLFRGIVALRRAAFAFRIVRSERVGVPVIVVGNITVGGTGKTPLVLWMTAFLERHGRHPAIVSRGYGSSSREVRPVLASSDATEAGDEPLLLARRSGCPVWIGADRAAVAKALLREHPECDVIVSDDGLQHYRLARDFEIAVLDATRGLGNGLMLPAGPLREPAPRLESVDAVVVNGERSAWPHACEMRLEGDAFRNLLRTDRCVTPEYFRGKRVCAIAGIGNPARFFEHLDRLGVIHEARAFPDHHAFRAADLESPEADTIVMTEKDAVKCAAFASEHMWVLPVDAAPDPRLGELVLKKLKLGESP